MKYKNVAFALTLLTPSLSASDTGQAVESCHVADVYCFTRNHERFCSDRAATVESCAEWIGYLEKRSTPRFQPELHLRTAEAYEALSRLASTATEAEQHRQHAIAIYRDLLRRDNANAHAMLGLAIVTEDKREKIELLRKGTELAPKEIYAMQLLASELLSSGDPEQALEAAKVMENAYANQSGRNKLHLASKTYELYLNAGATREAAEFKKQVMEALSTGNLKNMSADIDSKTVSRELMASCDHFIIPVLGSQRCMQDLEIVTQQLISKGTFEHSKELASTIAITMEDVAQSEVLADQHPNWNKTFLGWLASIQTKGLGTAEVYSAVARFTAGDDQLDALKRAVALDPKNGQLAWRLGAEFANREMWKEAVQELTRAKALVPSEQRAALDSELSAARKELAAKAGTPTTKSGTS